MKSVLFLVESEIESLQKKISTSTAQATNFKKQNRTVRSSLSLIKLNPIERSPLCPQEKRDTKKNSSRSNGRL
jgi:hypothetical protein